MATRVGLGLAELGDFEGAERTARPVVDFLQSHGEKGFLSLAAPVLGLALAHLGKLDEAEKLARLGEVNAPPDDWSSQVTWREVLSRVLAGRGELREAERVAREAVALCEGIDFPFSVGLAWENLGYVLGLSSKAEEAASALRRALALFEAKGNVMGVARTKEALADLGN